MSTLFIFSTRIIVTCLFLLPSNVHIIQNN